MDLIGHLSDSLDVSSRIRTRRRSTTSTKAKSSGLFEDESSTNFLPGPRARKSSHSRRSGAFGPDSSPPGVPRIIYTPPQSIRRRGRTNSIASSISGQTKASSLVPQGASIPVTGSSFLMTVPDISQQGLEQIIESRLIETFLTVSVLPHEANGTSPVKKYPLTRVSVSRGPAPARWTHSASLPTESKGKANTATAKPQPSKFKVSHSRSPSSSVSRTNGDDVLASSCLSGNVLSTVPDFFSPIHRPSINPMFLIDALPGHDFLSGSDTSCNRMRVQLWGHTKGPFPKIVGKQSQELVVDPDYNWTVVEEWEFSLNDLVPLSENVCSYVCDVCNNS